MTMAMDPKIACIGDGYWGKNLVRNFHALGMLSCVCETSPERRAEVAAAYPDAHLTDSFEEVLADPQVAGVAITTPTEAHGELVRRALPAGKDVFVEKPLCLSIAEGQELVSLASQLGRVLMGGRLLSCVSRPASFPSRRSTLDAGRLTFDAYPHSIAWKNHIPVANKADAHPIPFDPIEPPRAECLHFLECIRTHNRPRTDGEEGFRVLTVLQQCQEALESKTPQKPPPSTSEPRPYFAHESAFIDEGVEIGEGTTLWHVSHILKSSRVGRDCRIGRNVVIGPNVAIGDGVKIQNNVSVYEGVTLEDHVFCGPSMVFTNVFNPRSEIRRMEELRPTLVRRGERAWGPTARWSAA